MAPAIFWLTPSRAAILLWTALKPGCALLMGVSLLDQYAADREHGRERPDEERVLDEVQQPHDFGSGASRLTM